MTHQSQNQKMMNLILDIMVMNVYMDKFDEYNNMIMEKFDTYEWLTWAMDTQVMVEKIEKEKKKKFQRSQVRAREWQGFDGFRGRPQSRNSEQSS